MEVQPGDAMCLLSPEMLTQWAYQSRQRTINSHPQANGLP